MITAITWWIWGKGIELDLEKKFLCSTIIVSLGMTIMIDFCLVCIVWEIAF